MNMYVVILLGKNINAELFPVMKVVVALAEESPTNTAPKKSALPVVV